MVEDAPIAAAIGWSLTAGLIAAVGAVCEWARVTCPRGW